MLEMLFSYCFLIISLPDEKEIAELLLSRGIGVDLPSPIGTPLHVAATHGRDLTMKILLEHHADVMRQFLCTYCWLFKINIGFNGPYQCICLLSISCTTMKILCSASGK
jgi:ankyrin repeat protein